MANTYSGQRSIVDRPPPTVDPVPSARISRAPRDYAVRDQLTNPTTERQTSAPEIELWNDFERISPQKVKSLIAINQAIKNNDLRLRKFLVDQFAIKDDLVGFPQGFAGTLEGYRSVHDLVAFNDALSTALDMLGISECPSQLAA